MRKDISLIDLSLVPDPWPSMESFPLEIDSIVTEDPSFVAEDLSVVPNHSELIDFMSSKGRSPRKRINVPLHFILGCMRRLSVEKEAPLRRGHRFVLQATLELL